MYNMEIYCTRPYCIENLYWARRLRSLLVQYRFSIQYLSILYISLYNNLLLLKSSSLKKNCVHISTGPSVETRGSHEPVLLNWLFMQFLGQGF
jgi:hypothetical protein